MSLGLNHATLCHIDSLDTDHYAEDSYTTEEIDGLIQQEVPLYGRNRNRLPMAYNSLYLHKSVGNLPKK